MKIALIRGPHWNAWEQQVFEPLSRKHTVDVFVNPRGFHTLAPHGAFTIKTLGTRGNRWVEGIQSRLLGHSWDLHDLEFELRGYDVMHALECHTTFSWQAAQARRRHSIPLVLTVWETIPWSGERHPLRRKRKKETFAAADAFLAVTERTAEMLRTEGAPEEKIHVIPMGVDLSRFDANRREATPGDFEILSVARLVKEKGIYELLEAFASVVHSSPHIPWKLHYVGQGPEAGRLQKRVVDYGLQSRVRWSPHVGYEAIPKTYAHASVVVLASRPTRIWEEQFGYALVEAMAMGSCIVTTDSGAIPQVVGNAAVVIPHSNAPRLAEALKRLANSPEEVRQWQTKALAQAQTHFDRNRIAEKIEALYAGLLKR